jgi:hypothetical protein
MYNYKIRKWKLKDENKKDRNNYLFKYIENKSLNGDRNSIYGELPSGKFNFILYLLVLPPSSDFLVQNDFASGASFLLFVRRWYI